MIRQKPGPWMGSKSQDHRVPPVRGHWQSVAGKRRQGVDRDLSNDGSRHGLCQRSDDDGAGEICGKRIRIAGILNVASVDGNYYCCIISDAQGCCQNGIEFVWETEVTGIRTSTPGKIHRSASPGSLRPIRKTGTKINSCRLKMRS